jgi:uncharacterized protein YprB with RNaseH-like and TPR domain
VAEVVGLELRNVVANYPFERSHRFAGIQPNSSYRDYSRLSCAAGEMPPLGPRAAGIFSQTFCADVWPPSGIAVRHEAISSDPKMLPSVAFCDVETTGLSKDDRIVSLSGIGTRPGARAALGAR